MCHIPLIENNATHAGDVALKHLSKLTLSLPRCSLSFDFLSIFISLLSFNWPSSQFETYRWDRFQEYKRKNIFKILCFEQVLVFLLLFFFLDYTQMASIQMVFLCVYVCNDNLIMYFLNVQLLRALQVPRLVPLKALINC